MAKLNTIELDKSVSDIVNKVFKLGGPANKIATSVVNALISKMIYGSKEEQKSLISLLVPEVLNSTDAMKLITNIDKYKETEKEKLLEFMNELDNSLGIEEKKTTIKRNNNLNKPSVENKSAIADDEEL